MTETRQNKILRMRRIARDMMSRGFWVFPIVEDDNEPLAGRSRYKLATNDPAKIDELWDEPYNVAIDTDRSNLVVLDADKHAPGQNGIAGLIAIDAPMDTFAVKSPGDGLHLYYSGAKVASLIGQLAPGLDIRSHGQYVVAPGCARSKYGGKLYEVVNDAPIMELPLHLRQMMRPPRQKDESLADAEHLDTPESIAQATSYLIGPAPMAIEGQGGNSQTFKVAARLRDFGLSAGQAFELMLNLWNEQKAHPRWEKGELEGLVRNAYSYASGAVGSESVEVQFEGVKIPVGLVSAPSVAVPPPSADIIRFGAIQPHSKLPPRPWVLQPFLMRRQLSGLVAAGATGKSTLVMWMAACVATGRPFLGQQVISPGKVIIFSSEDDRDEMDRRAHAFCIANNLDPDEVMANISFVPGSELRLKLATGKNAEVNRPLIAALAGRCRDEGVALIVVDPLTGTHESDENDNTAMGRVAEALELLAHEANASLLMVHHTKKGYGKNGQSAAGDADAGRGAGAVIASARLNFTLVEASEADCEEYGLPDTERSDFVRLDGAKLNLTRKTRDPIWFKREGIPLLSGDEVAVLKTVDVSKEADEFRRSTAETIEAAMEQDNLTSVTVYKAASMLRVLDAMFGAMPQRTVEHRVKALLKIPLRTSKGTMKLKRVQEGEKVVEKVVLE